MTKENILYGIPESETERYMEIILTVSTDMERIEAVKVMASKDGFHSFRISTFSGEKPSFNNILNKLETKHGK